MSIALSTLEQLLALAETMLGAAENGDWDFLASLESERSTLVNRLPENLAANLAGAESSPARRLIEDFQRCEVRLRPLVESRLNELRVVLREVRPGA